MRPNERLTAQQRERLVAAYQKLKAQHGGRQLGRNERRELAREWGIKESLLSAIVRKGEGRT